MAEQTQYQKSGAFLQAEMDWLGKVLDWRFLQHFSETEMELEPMPAAPEIGQGPYAAFLTERQPNTDERLMLALALAAYLRPWQLDNLYIANPVNNRSFSAFGGNTSVAGNQFWPTGETALWLLAGQDLTRRIEVQQLFGAGHYFAKEDILRLEHPAGQPGNHPFAGLLKIGEEFFAEICHSGNSGPNYSSEFPAEEIVTAMSREDIILSPATWSAVDEIMEWLQYRDAFEALPGMKKRMRPGYRALFYGPPGTGKTMVASWMGSRVGKPVYRIDLSMIVSKYIGETEKNLANVFRKAAYRDWILFFDEADALFGKRTSVSSSHDRHANQEVSYLLQRVESYPGLVILASNFKDNMDEAFIRRFDLMAHFAMPNPMQRMELWRTAFSPALPLAKEVDIFALAKKYELSGGHITNVVRFATMKALQKQASEVQEAFVTEGIKKEMAKLGINRLD